MPTYDYSCDACRHEFEAFEPITAQPQKKCPKCKKNRLRRLFGAGAGLIFKGSGFYQTDYRSESYNSAAKADQEAAKPASTPPADTSGTTGTGKSESSKSDKGKTPKSSG